MAVVSTFIPQFPLPPSSYDARDQTELRANMRAALTGVVVAIAELDEQIGAAYPTELDDLTDVSLTALGNNEILLSSSGTFINQTFAEAGISAVGHSHVHTDITDFDTEVNALIAAKALEYLSDVAAYDTLGAGELLEWSGSAWVHQTKAEAGISEVGHGHTVSDISDFATEVDSAINAHEYMDFFNGTFIESFQTTLSESGGVVTMSLEQSGGGDLTARFSSGEVTIDCTPAATIALTLGTDASPQANYIYVLESTGVVTKSTSGWPSAEHVKIAFFNVPSAAFVAANGAYVHQNWNDHAAGTDGMGHMAHMAERSRRDGAYWFSGLEGTGTDDYLTITTGNVEFQMATGVAYQMHKHTFPAFDTSLGDVVLVKNWSGDAYHDITNLYDITTDSTGSTITNNRWFTLVVWAVANNTGTYHPTIINLPNGTYQTEAQALADLDGTADYSVPREFDLDSSTAVLVCRLIVQKQATTWAYGSTVDLRGLNDAIAAGGGGGGGGVAATEFSDAAFRVFDDVDNTKVLALQVSGVTTATTRTLTIPDASGTIELEGHTHVEADITDLDHTDADAIHDNVAGEIALVTEKASPVSGDFLLIEDSADSNNKKRVQIGNLPSSGGVTDHGALTGLADDDHTQYSLVDGTRAFTGAVTFDGVQDIIITPGAVPKIASTGIVQLEAATGSYHYFTINNATVATIQDEFFTLGSSTTTDLKLYEPTAGEWTIEAQSTNELVFLSGSNVVRIDNANLIIREPADTARVKLYRANTSLASPTAVTNGNWIGDYQFYGYDGTGYDLDAIIRARASEDHTGTNHGTDLLFYATPDAHATAEIVAWYNASAETFDIEAINGLVIDATTGLLEIQSTEDAKIILRDDGTSAWNRIDFYELTDRHGYFGFGTGNNFLMVNEESAGTIALQTTGSGQITVSDDAGSNTARVASIDSIVDTGTPSGTPPYGAMYMVY